MVGRCVNVVVASMLLIKSWMLSWMYLFVMYCIIGISIGANWVFSCGRSEVRVVIQRVVATDAKMTIRSTILFHSTPRIQNSFDSGYTKSRRCDTRDREPRLGHWRGAGFSRFPNR